MTNLELKSAYENNSLTSIQMDTIWKAIYQTADNMGVDADNLETSSDFWDYVDEDEDLLAIMESELN